jgi:hypothetical protein
MAKQAAKSQSLALPDNVFSMLAEADKQRGFPPGTMQSLMMQETSGGQKYIQDPTTYHYAPDAGGKRKSSARGPFGILDSTARDPGYGVKPMGDNTSLSEHVRFAGDYLAARSKSAGSLSAGLAGYGEGEKYATQVMGRIEGKAPVMVAKAAAPVMAQAAPILSPAVMPDQMMAQAMPVPVAVPQEPQAQPAQPAAPVMAAAQPDPWQMHLEQLRASQAPVQVADLAYGGPAVAAMPQFQRPDFMAALSMMGQVQSPNFRPFTGMRAKV